jgi:hypothetical protein
MQDCCESYFGKLPSNYRKIIKWDTPDNVFNDYLKKSLRLYWHMNATRYKDSRLSSNLNSKQLNILVTKNDCFTIDIDICNIVELVKHLKKYNTLCKLSIDSMLLWFNCAEKDPLDAMMKLKLIITKKEPFKNIKKSINRVNKIMPKFPTNEFEEKVSEENYKIEIGYPPQLKKKKLSDIYDTLNITKSVKRIRPKKKQFIPQLPSDMYESRIKLPDNNYTTIVEPTVLQGDPVTSLIENINSILKYRNNVTKDDKILLYKLIKSQREFITHYGNRDKNGMENSLNYLQDNIIKLSKNENNYDKKYIILLRRFSSIMGKLYKFIEDMGY